MGKDYEVGYGRPPKHSQFQTGQSGNPGGRKTGQKGLRTDLERSLDTVTTLQHKLTGKMVKGRNQEQAINRLVERAALGDLKAQALLFPLIAQVLGFEDRHRGPRALSEQDSEILAAVLEGLLPEAEDTDLPGDAEGRPALPSPDTGEPEEPEEPDDA